MKISDRQLELLDRYNQVLIREPEPVCRAWVKSGIGRTSFLRFINSSKVLSRNSLNKLEKFILQKELEFGL